MFTGSSTTPGFNSDAAILAGENGSIYLFGLDTYGYPLFSGDSYSQRWGSLAPELNDYLGGPFGGRDVVSVGDTFGETFLYYSTRNPARGKAPSLSRWCWLRASNNG